MTAMALEGAPRTLRLRVSDALYRRRALLILLLLVPPMLWVGAVYVGSLLALLANSFFRLDHFTGQVVREVGLGNFVALVEGANVDVVLRTVTMALLVTAACIALALPVAWYMARYASGAKKAVLYLAVMLPLWSSYLVRLYAWKLLLAKEGAISWVLAELHLGWVLEALLAMPVIGGHSLSFSPLGTFIVFVYLWLPFMILPIQAALEDVLARGVPAGRTGDCRGLDLHLLPYAWRLHRPGRDRRFLHVHRPGGFAAAGHRWQRAARGGAVAGAGRGDCALPVGGETAGGLRCALAAAAARRRQSGSVPRPGR
jgi:putative spermidine/putrescine transport system permease protein